MTSISTPRAPQRAVNHKICTSGCKKSAKSFGGSVFIAIFAPSKLYCGADAAGLRSGVFCAPNFRERNITTPSRDAGNRPGVFAVKYLTARSVVSLCQNFTVYVHDDDEPRHGAGREGRRSPDGEDMESSELSFYPCVQQACRKPRKGGLVSRRRTGGHGGCLVARRRSGGRGGCLASVAPGGAAGQAACRGGGLRLVRGRCVGGAAAGVCDRELDY